MDDNNQPPRSPARLAVLEYLRNRGSNLGKPPQRTENKPSCPAPSEPPDNSPSADTTAALADTRTERERLMAVADRVLKRLGKKPGRGSKPSSPVPSEKKLEPQSR
jgi:hypothetical protein